MASWKNPLIKAARASRGVETCPDRSSLRSSVHMSRNVRVWGAGGGGSSSGIQLRATGSVTERLCAYVGRKRQLERHNQELEEEITEILARRGTPEERDWEEVQKPLDGLRNKVREVTLGNNKLLLRVDSIKQATADYKTKLEAEQQVQWMIEQDLVGLKKNRDEIQLNCSQLHKQIEFVKEETAHFKKEHKHEVDKLHEKIKDFSVKVEVDSRDSSLAELLNKTHVQCDRLAKKNAKEGDDWYQKKLDTIKAEVAQNTEALQFGQTELNKLLRDKRQLEIMIRAKLSTICFLEEKLKDTKGEYNHKLAQANQIVLGLEAELRQVRMQMDHQMNDYHLLNDMMMLGKGISSYQELMQGVTTDTNSLQLTLEEARHSGRHKCDQKVTQKQEAPAEEENTSSSKNQEVQDGGLYKAEMVAVNTVEPITMSNGPKTRKSSSSSNSSSSDNEDKKSNDKDVPDD